MTNGPRVFCICGDRRTLLDTFGNGPVLELHSPIFWTYSFLWYHLAHSDIGKLKIEISVKLNEYSKSEESISNISWLLVESFVKKNEIFTPTFIIWKWNFEKSLLSGCLVRPPRSRSLGCALFSKSVSHLEFQYRKR